MESAQPKAWVQESRTAKSMGQITLNSSASSAAISLSGSVGETHISASPVTNARMKGITFLGMSEINFQNAQAPRAVL